MAARSYGNPLFNHPGIAASIFAALIIVGFIFAVYTGGTSGHAEGHGGDGEHPAAEHH